MSNLSPLLQKPQHLSSEDMTESGQKVTRADVISWDRLDAADRMRWQRFRSSQPAMKTPFFSTRFMDAVHAARGDVSVAILENDESIVGFLPFHQVGRTAKPVGRFMNDAHNVIAAPDTRIDWPWFLRQCGVAAFDFHALVGTTDHLTSDMIHGQTESFSSNLGDDSIAFLKQLEKSHRTIKKQEQKTRKMIREVGPLRLEFDCRDPQLLEQTIAWKRHQYRRTNILDLFTPSWTRRMLRHLHGSDVSGDASSTEPVSMETHVPDSLGNENREMRGIHSVLWAGDTVVAAHIGMIEDDLLHYWFPTYSIEHSIYSPGTALFKAILAAGTENGIRTVDMGYGEQPYKRKQTDTITTVVHGCVTGSRLLSATRRIQRGASEMIKRLPMKQHFKSCLRCLKPDAGIGKLR